MLMYHIRQIFFVALALAALSALAQTPPVKKAAKPGQPVFADLENLTQTKPEVGGQKPEAGKLAPESGNQESKIKNQQSPALWEIP